MHLTFISALAATIRHVWHQELTLNRLKSPELIEELRAATARSELTHTGEIRLCIEGGLPPSYIWRGYHNKLPLDQIVHERAEMQFSKLRIWDTNERNGILIYVLLSDRRIELIADRNILAIVSREKWQLIVHTMQIAFSKKQFREGLLKALHDLSLLLQTHFPQSSLREASNLTSGNQLIDEPHFN